MSHLNVFVLGIDHEIQRTDALRSDAMKQHYRDLLNQIIDQQRVQVIGEEANPNQQCVGRELSISKGLPRPWKNIDMGEEIRKELGIYDEQANRLIEPRLGKVESHVGEDGYYADQKNGSYLFVQRVPSDAIREQYMCEQAIEGTGDAKSILVLCGHLHAPEVAKRFGKYGHNVMLDMLHNYDWYSPINL